MSNGQELENEQSASRALTTLRYATSLRGGCSDCAGLQEETIALLTELMHMCQGDVLNFSKAITEAASRFADDVGSSGASGADVQEAAYVADDVAEALRLSPVHQLISQNTEQPRLRETDMSEQNIQLKPDVATTLTMPGGGRLIVTLTREGVVEVRGFDADNDSSRPEWAQALRAPPCTFEVVLQVRGKITLKVRVKDEAQLERWMTASNVVDEAMRWGDFVAEDDLEDHDYSRVGDHEGVDLDLTE